MQPEVGTSSTKQPSLGQNYLLGIAHLICAVKNHGLKESLQSDLFEQCTQFFDLPLEEKMKILADKNNRGYTPYKEETLSPLTQSSGDTKEGLYFGREISSEDPEAAKPLHGPNQWPSSELLPQFQPVVNRYFDACKHLSFRCGQC